MIDQITPAQMIECARRELRMRESVYPDRVAKRRMTQAKADHEIAAMRAILRDLEARYPEAERQPAFL